MREVTNPSQETVRRKSGDGRAGTSDPVCCRRHGEVGRGNMTLPKQSKQVLFTLLLLLLLFQFQNLILDGSDCSDAPAPA